MWLSSSQWNVNTCGVFHLYSHLIKTSLTLSFMFLSLLTGRNGDYLQGDPHSHIWIWHSLHQPGFLDNCMGEHHSNKLFFYSALLHIKRQKNPKPCVVFESFNTRWLVIMVAAAATAKSLQSCPSLFDPIEGSPPVSPVPGILQARTLEWVAISFSNAWKWKVKVKSLSRVRLLVTPWTAAHQAPPPMGFSRQEYWSGVPLPSPIMVVSSP